MKLLYQNSLIKFDRQFPIYNFFFPSQSKTISQNSMLEVFEAAQDFATSRALYFHIPFCDTICNFCPFTRGKYLDHEVIDRYFEQLMLEIKMKADMINLKNVPIGAIFFGGGTPSLLNEEQILQIGEAIHQHFDLSKIREFSFEIEVKSLTPERAYAMKSIGVTHPRFGLQTFSPKWRDIFDLTATIEQIYVAANLLKEIFSYQTFDILYGMSGQDEEELVADLEAAVNMGTTNIDIYPIDNIVTQVSLHKKLRNASMEPTSAMRKFSMNMLIDQFMRHAGFMPHNGHGYVRMAAIGDVVSNNVVSNAYSFVYHEHVYGYHNFDLMGFGINAISSTKGHVITNTHSKKIYAEQLADGKFHCTISQHDIALDYSRPIILRLAYHGLIDKSLVQWDKIHPEVLEKLDHLKRESMVVEDDFSISLTKLGWYWYVNLMYYLMPKQDQLLMNSVVVSKLKNKGRSFVKKELLYPLPTIQAAVKNDDLTAITS